MTDQTTILKISGLTKRYPGVLALDHVDMEFRTGEVHAIVGENGAGKSTLIKTIAGAIPPDAGTITFDCVEYSRLNPELSAKLGIGVVYQEFAQVPSLTVAENIFLGHLKGSALKVNFKQMEAEAEAILDRVGIKLPVNRAVLSLTAGQCQIVEIARAMTRDLKFIILDEPTAPLTKNEVDQLFSVIASLKAAGVTTLYITHRLEEVFEISDRVSVLRDGKYITTLKTSETNTTELIQHMVGRELSKTFPPRKVPVGDEVVLEVENLTGNGVRDINFALHKGEILGFSGLLGCGRTETMQMIFGAAKKKSGTVRINGNAVDIRNTSQAFANGIGLVPEDRKQHGAFMPMSIRWNISLSSLNGLMKGPWIDRRKERGLAQEYRDKLRIKTPSLEQMVGNLSGGNQQKVVIAKVMAANAEIIIFDEPTRGIDVGAKQEMYKLLRELVESGKSVILISSEMEEVIGLADRMVVLYEGRQMGILDRQDFDQEKILKLASGITEVNRGVGA